MRLVVGLGFETGASLDRNSPTRGINDDMNHLLTSLRAYWRIIARPFPAGRTRGAIY